MEDIIRQIYAQAKLLGACSLFTGREKTLEDIFRLFSSTKGMEFCLKNRFPNLSTFRLFKPFGVEKYGVYIDAGFVELKNPKRAILIGRTTAVIDCDTLEKHEIYVFQGASATVNARKWSVVSIKGVTGARVIKNVSENAIIL